MGTMTDVEFFILLGTVLAGVIWQRVDIQHLTGRIDRLDTEVTGRIDRLNDDMKQFYRSLGQHYGRLDSIEKRLT